ncbi:MAG TPA: hypothetical protein VL460_07505 [Caulobacteraceae bacterium]|nr:hypothetical protein [Caulobacteraceae bacterium]
MNPLEALRARARRSLYEYDGRTGRAIARVFADPLPVPLLDVAALAMAQELARALTLDPARVRRLLAAAQARGAVPVAVVGDSHSTHLVRRALRDGRWLLPLHLLCTGASARGLANPAAAAGAGAKVRELLAELPPMPTAFMFGQVDVEFVHAFKRLETGVGAFDADEFDAFAEETVGRYIALLAEASPKGLKPLVRVATIFPPALSDAAWRQGYVNAHIAHLHGPADLAGLGELQIPSLAQRTRLHARFNTRLAAAARAAEFGVLDLFEPLLGGKGTVKRSLLGRAQGANHHLGYGASRRPLVEAMWGMVGP